MNLTSEDLANFSIEEQDEEDLTVTVKSDSLSEEDKILQEFNRELSGNQQSEFESNLDNAYGKNPEEELQYQNDLEFTGLPRNTRAPRETIKELSEEQKKKEYYELIRKFGRTTADFYSRPENADIAWDAIQQFNEKEKKYNEFERHLKEKPSQTLHYTAKRFASGFLLGNVQGISGAYEAIADVYADISEVPFEALADVLDIDNPLYNNTLKTFKNANPFRQAVIYAGLAREKAKEDREKVSRSTSTGNFVMDAALSGVESFGQNAPWMAAAPFTGGSTSLVGMSVVSGGTAAGEGKDQGLDPLRALGLGVTHGLIEFGTEKIPMDQMLKSVKFGDSYFQTLLKAQIAEAPTEQVATVLQDFADWAILPENEDKPFMEYVEEIPENALQTFIATLVATSGQASTVYAADQVGKKISERQLRKYNESKDEVIKYLKNDESQQKLDELITLSQSNLLAKRDSKRYREFMEELSKTDEVVYVPVDVVSEMEEIPPILEEQLNDLGVDIEIPLRDFLSDIALDEEYIEYLRPHVKTSPDGFSMEEIEAGGDNAIAELITQAQSNVEEQDELDAGYDNIRQQLEDTGRITESESKYNAALVKSYVSRVGRDYNLSPQQVFDRMNLEIVGPDADISQPAVTLEQSVEDGYRKIQERDAETIKTGDPVVFNYSHNTQSATEEFGIPDKDSLFGRGFEPSGKYISIVGDNYTPATDQFETGVVRFDNPLVLSSEGVQWKEKLSNEYGGLTGKELSKAVIADGYDGIITTEGDRYISEIVDLTVFDEAKALYQSDLGFDQPLVTAPEINTEDQRDIGYHENTVMASNNSGAFIQPHELNVRNQRDIDQKWIEKLNIPEEMREEYVNDHKPEHSVDPVTGFYDKEYRPRVMQRAREFLTDNRHLEDQTVYVEIDIANLGGLNDARGHSGADKVYRNMSTIVSNTLDQLGEGNDSFDQVNIRHGGDEFSFILFGVEKQAVNDALASAKESVRMYIESEGLSDIMHAKEKIPNFGVGIEYGTSNIDTVKTDDEVWGEADQQVEVNKRGAKADEQRSQTGQDSRIQPQPGPTGGQPGTIATGETSGRTGQAESGAGQAGNVQGRINPQNITSPKDSDKLEQQEIRQLTKRKGQVEKLRNCLENGS